MRGLTAIILVLSCQTAFAENPASIQIKGSDTMVNLGQAWAEVFMTEHPSTQIAVTGGGSGTGLAALANGTADIAQSSRSMNEKERELIQSKGQSVAEIETAIDALTVVVRPDNPVKELTLDQLSSIFSGRVTNWSQVGGKNQAILVLSRERNSGTHVYFLEEVVRHGNPKGPEEFAPNVLMMSSSQAIVQEVADNPAAIGYFGLGYLTPHVKALALSKSGGPFVSPSVQTALDKSYSLSRPLYFYLPKKPEGMIKEFVDFVLSERGQAIVLEMDFVPLHEANVRTDH